MDAQLTKKSFVFASKVVISFMMWMALLLGMSYQVFQSWAFLAATYGFM